MLPVIGELRPWADPGITAIGRLGARPPTVAHADVTAARAADRAASPWWASLDGRWRFDWFDDVDEVPAAAVGPIPAPPDGAEPTDRSRGGTTAAVPGNWTLQRAGRDHGDLPWYTNVSMPFPGPPPALADRIPTGVYRRTFTVQRRWSDRRIVIGIGGAESVHAVYVNGRFAGYGTDSKLASDYDVTDHVRPGRNHLAVVVLRWSAHSYVEDQDQWWMAGLHREVTLEARAQTAIDSLVADAGLDLATGCGTLTVDTTVGSTTGPGPGWTVRTTVETLGGRRIAPTRTSPVPHRFAQPYVFRGHRVIEAFTIPGVRPWTAETPHRYRVIAELIDPNGATTEVHAAVIGFRDVAVRDGRLCVNGVPVLLFGVNRHDHHPERGTAVTDEDRREDLIAMKRANVNAIRCAHYPNDPRLLDLCDELGFYVVDEANLEAHAYNTSLCDDPAFRTTWLERGARMVTRDRNHPSVIMWSLGNESGAGVNHAALAAWIRDADPSRPLHYEGAVFHRGWQHGHDLTDVVCPMYPTVEAIADYRGDRPLIMCEYSHAMGNSNGGLAAYWDAIDASFRSGGPLQGGFVWEWRDHGLLARLPNGRRGFAYGGMFGEPFHDGNFVADGIMASDLEPHPAVHELAWAHRPAAVSAGPGDASVTVWNRRSFTTLDDLRATWHLLIDGTEVDAGTLDTGRIGPLAEAIVPLPGPAVGRGRAAAEAGAEVAWTVRWTLRRATPWAPARHRVAHDQVTVHRPTDRAVGTGRGPAPSIRTDVARPRSVVDGEISLCLVRAPVDNDGFKLMPELHERLGVGGGAHARWVAAGLFDLAADDLVDHDHEVSIDDDGAEVHHHRVVIADHLADPARLGVRFRLAAPGRSDRAGVRPDRARIRWYGRGPHENYPDRNRSAALGTWEGPLDPLPYLVPQEYGLRTECRWFECVDTDTGFGVRIEAVSPPSLHCSATRHALEALHAAGHVTDLGSADTSQVHVHVDLAHRGLGTASCGPDVAAAHRIEPGEYRWSWRLVPLGQD